MKTGRRRWRCLVNKWRLCGLVICCIIALSWIRLLFSEDYNISADFNPDQDPVYTGSRKDDEHLPVSRFPVMPDRKRAGPTSPRPLLESDVIPNAANMTRALQMALSVHSQPPIVIVCDYGFIDMAVNFIKLSVVPLKLSDRLLAVCTDADAAETLSRLGYPCTLLNMDHAGSHQATDFGTDEYYRKTNIKTWVVKQILREKRSLLLTDVDVILFRDPFQYFSCADCDIHIQMDRQLYNSGFVYAKYTSASVSLYDQAWQFYLDYHTGHDQAYLNMAITAMSRQGLVKVQELSVRQFPCGAYYFENDYRHFRNSPPCSECVMAHNNYIGTTAAKIYRFKENLLWVIDHNGYYSDPTAKYITYHNPYDFGPDTINMERAALLQAMVLAEISGRMLILPSFRCCNCLTRSCDHPSNRCSLLSVLKVKTFDHVFKSKYREHTFLDHGLVPAEVRSSVSPLLRANYSVPPHTDISRYIPELRAHSTVLPDLQHTDALMDVLRQYANYSVIDFHSLYWNISVSTDHIQRLDAGLRCALYEQWEISLEEKIFGKRLA